MTYPSNPQTVSVIAPDGSTLLSWSGAYIPPPGTALPQCNAVVVSGAHSLRVLDDGSLSITVPGQLTSQLASATGDALHDLLLLWRNIFGGVRVTAARVCSETALHAALRLVFPEIRIDSREVTRHLRMLELKPANGLELRGCGTLRSASAWQVAQEGQEVQEIPPCTATLLEAWHREYGATDQIISALNGEPFVEAVAGIGGLSEGRVDARWVSRILSMAEGKDVGGYVVRRTGEKRNNAVLWRVVKVYES